MFNLVIFNSEFLSLKSTCYNVYIAVKSLSKRNSHLNSSVTGIFFTRTFCRPSNFSFVYSFD